MSKCFLRVHLLADRILKQNAIYYQQNVTRKTRRARAGGRSLAGERLGGRRGGRRTPRGKGGEEREGRGSAEAGMA
jgi:hypothetical protein